MAGDLKNRVIAITGAGRGLGRSHALLLASKGARIVVNDLEENGESPARGVVDEIIAAGGEAVADNHSVTGWDSAAAIIQTAIDRFGRLDGLVCNAGFLRDRMMVNMTEQEWDDLIKVHLYGTFYPLRHAASYWREQHGRGESVNAAVVTTTAISGLHSTPGQMNYGAAKSAIAHDTIVAARELERYGVRVNAVSPLARTRLTENVLPPSADDDYDMADPIHASMLVAWLLSADCKVSAQVYGVHGRTLVRYNRWHPGEHETSSQDWTVASLAAAMDEWPSSYQKMAVPGLPREV